MSLLLRVVAVPIIGTDFNNLLKVTIFVNHPNRYHQVVERELINPKQYKHPYQYYFTQNLTLSPKMNRDVITDLVFANLLDLIPLIKNTDEEMDHVILRVYERTAAILEEI